jgi:hypothetical protein
MGHGVAQVTRVYYASNAYIKLAPCLDFVRAGQLGMTCDKPDTTSACAPSATVPPSWLNRYLVNKDSNSSNSEYWSWHGTLAHNNYLMYRTDVTWGAWVERNRHLGTATRRATARTCTST